MYYFLGERLGNARILTNSSSTVVEESDYYPFGQERVVSGTGAANNYKYTGHERDTESGLDHTLHRQYACNLGRWLSPDPMRGNRTNPQSLNRYAYGGNSPVNATDPDGGCPVYNPDWQETGGPELSPCEDLPRPTRFIDEDSYDWGAYTDDEREAQANELAQMMAVLNVNGGCATALRNRGFSFGSAQAMFDRVNYHASFLQEAAARHNIDWRYLAAIGMWESNYENKHQRVYNGRTHRYETGPGRGIFQIEGNGVSDADAFDPIASMEWSAAEAERFLSSDFVQSAAGALGIDPYALAALNHNLGDGTARAEINRVLALGLSGPAALLQLNSNRASGSGSSMHSWGVMGMMACFDSTD